MQSSPSCSVHVFTPSTSKVQSPHGSIAVHALLPGQTTDSIAAELGHEKLSLVKYDIKGTELTDLKNWIDAKAPIDQVCQAEFDFMPLKFCRSRSMLDLTTCKLLILLISIPCLSTTASTWHRKRSHGRYECFFGIYRYYSAILMRIG